MSEAAVRRERTWGELAAAAGLEGGGAAGVEHFLPLPFPRNFGETITKPKRTVVFTFISGIKTNR